jgi:hypothetical protein
VDEVAPPVGWEDENARAARQWFWREDLTDFLSLEVDWLRLACGGHAFDKPSVVSDEILELIVEFLTCPYRKLKAADDRLRIG